MVLLSALSNVLIFNAYENLADKCTISGGDGLVKLWAVRTNECIATYDHHEDKVLESSGLSFSLNCSFILWPASI